MNNYTPSSSSASNNNNNNSVNANSSTTSITNLTNSFHSTASGSRRKSFIKRPRSSTTNSFNNRLEDSFTPLNSLITSFDSNNNNDAATTLPLSPNSPPKLKHTQSQLNCCSYAELICDESWSTHSHGDHLVVLAVQVVLVVREDFNSHLLDQLSLRESSPL